MRNLLPWRTVASVVFAATAAAAWADNGAPSDSAKPTTPGNAMTPDRSTPDERHGDADLNSGASPSPQDIGPRGVPTDTLKHKWPNSGGTSQQDPATGTGQGSTEEDQGTTDSQPAPPASPFSPVNPAAPALQDPQGGDPTNPVTPATMRYMILA